ncbi:PhoX family protein [Limnohabitans sp.]|jgi:secreted PhoX family phosphatase|uniref:PhoX family protein n=1 Tax=Limnohabitans sp. TaxID=1907725 RepID=UPI0037C17FC9
MSHHDHDPVFNTSDNPHFQDVLTQALQNPARRGLLRGGLGLAGLAMLPGCASMVSGVAAAPSALGFPSLDKSLLDNVILPPGYQYTVLHATGDALDSTLPAYSNKGTETDDWSRRIGDHHDGMDIYYIDANGRYTENETGRAVLCVNHESSADAHLMHPNGQTSNGVSGKKFHQFGNWDLGNRPELEVLKEINHHGVSVVEIVKTPQGWRIKQDSPLNRRITAQTPARISGPRAEIDNIRSFMVTRWDTAGAMSRGTLNNCGHGKTPWGTYLGCEENWAFYFQATGTGTGIPPKEVAARRRYGVAAAAPAAGVQRAISQGWHTVSATDDRFARWNLAATGANAERDFRNEANTFGYNVEIDPLAPNSTPAKRVAMGRFAHEAAVCGIPKAGEPLAFYMGCDSRNEYIYKFVSTAVWDPRDVGGGLVAGDKYLSEGKLYAARFDATGQGEWLELTIANPRIANFATYKFANQADVLVNPRLAADAVGATKMDRPEWGAVNHRNGEIYFALTNNSAANRTPTKVDAANPRAYMDVDGKKGIGNPNGHIIRFKEADNKSTAKAFAWDIFLFGAEEDAGDANLSGLSDKNAFSSPDGMWFSKATGICWIQTDDGAMTDESNCMMLAAIPGQVGDGGKVTVKNKMVVGGVEQTGTQETFVGAALGDAKLRRFLVAPKGAEVTGITETADGRTLFVNIQHPGELSKPLASGEAPQSIWPGNQGYGVQGRPRSATIVITRKDGGVIGL